MALAAGWDELSARSKERLYFGWFVITAVLWLLIAVEISCYAAAHVHGVRLTMQYKQEIANELKWERLSRFAIFACSELNVPDCSKILAQPTETSEDHEKAASRSFQDIQRIIDPYSFVLISVSNSTWSSKQKWLQDSLPLATIFVVGVTVACVCGVAARFTTYRAYMAYRRFKKAREAKLDHYTRESVSDMIARPITLDHHHPTISMPYEPQNTEGMPLNIRYRAIRPNFQEKAY